MTKSNDQTQLDFQIPSRIYRKSIEILIETFECYA